MGEYKEKVMLPASVWMKYLWRVAHIGSLVILCQGIISNWFAGELTTAAYPMLYMMSGILVILSGVVNTVLMRPKDMGDNRQLWMVYHHLKTLTGVALVTPVNKMLHVDVATKINMQFYWMLAIMLLSPLARFYR